MCGKDNFLPTLLAVFTIFLISCRAQDIKPKIQPENNLVYVHQDYWTQEPSLRCYDCNSQYDPACGDPFNTHSIETVNCSAKKAPEHLIRFDTHPGQTIWPTVCRKIVQKIDIGQGTTKRVIRECGYIQDNIDDKKCSRKTGTMGVETLYCSCTTSLCNDGASVRPLLTHIGISIVLGIVAKAIILL